MADAPTEPVPHMSPDEFRRRGRELIDWIADYHERVDGLPVLSNVKPGVVTAGLPGRAPERGEDWDAILREALGADGVIQRGITHWQSGNFFGFFPANASFPAILGELLSAGLGVQGMLWATSPACTELETRVMDWLGGAIGLPTEFLSGSENGGGVIQGTASEAAVVGMLAAKKRVIAGGTEASRLCVYASTQAHSSIIKAAMIVGLADSPEDRRHVRFIETDAGYAMRPEALEAAMRQDVAAGKTPAFVCATVGTTSSGAVDPVGEVGRVIERVGSESKHPWAWLHVDAAWAGAACICPEHRGMLVGIERADSVCFNPHKWLLTNFDCSALWTRDRRSLTGAMSVTPEYLKNAASESGGVIDYRDWQVPLGRRFRALKLWFVLRHYGLEGLRTHIREHVRLGEVFERLVRSDGRYEVATARSLSLVCFRLARGVLSADEANRRNRLLLDRLNATGRLYLTHTVLPTAEEPGRVVLRMAIGAARTGEAHVRGAWDEIARAAGAVCSGS